MASCSGVTAESDGAMLADRRCMNMQSSCETKKILLYITFCYKNTTTKGGRCFFFKKLSIINIREACLSGAYLTPSVLTVITASCHHAADSTSSVVPILIGGLKNTSNAEMHKTILQIAI